MTTFQFWSSDDKRGARYCFGGKDWIEAGATRGLMLRGEVEAETLLDAIEALSDLHPHAADALSTCIDIHFEGDFGYCQGYRFNEDNAPSVSGLCKAIGLREEDAEVVDPVRA